MPMDLIAFQNHYPFAVPTIAFIFGSAFGSFLNVVVYRLPKMMLQEWHGQAIEIIEEVDEDAALSQRLRQHLNESDEPLNLTVPSSRCPDCGARIRPWHNIPILSWFMLQGQCTDCDTAISPRYPIVEFGTALLTMLVIIQFGASLQGITACFFTWALIALALIDFDTQLLPDDITLLFLWLGLIANFFSLFIPLEEAFLGAIIGYMSLWTIYQLFKLVTGKEGLGFGDFKMLAMLGAWLGLSAIPLIIIVSSFAGAIFGGVLLLFGWNREKPIQFGPFLAIAGWIALMWGDQLTILYLDLAIRSV
ncbi:uncharacterized protein METZ01_LOCUS265152 [marine metagenome]|uniref:Prepilin leader peptidase/N-methyltransferase n=1 Tax=marine metagenome TaxID=408172 RepID=A0A382JKN9_9ZZZZ